MLPKCHSELNEFWFETLDFFGKALVSNCNQSEKFTPFSV